MFTENQQANTDSSANSVLRVAIEKAFGAVPSLQVQDYLQEGFPIKHEVVLAEVKDIAKIASEALSEWKHQRKVLKQAIDIENAFRAYARSFNATLPENCCLSEKEYEAPKNRIIDFLAENNMGSLNPRNLRTYWDNANSKITALKNPLKHFSTVIKLYEDLAQYPNLKEDRLRAVLPVLENFKMDVIAILSRYHVSY